MMQEKKKDASSFSYEFADGDRRLAFSRQPSFRQWDPHLLSPNPPLMQQQQQQRSHSFKPYLARSDSTAAMPLLDKSGKKDATWIALMLAAVKGLANGSRPMKRLALMISLNVAYSMIELLIGLFTARIGLVSDAFHLTFGCGILTFSLFAMAISTRKPGETYTYGYKRLQVLAAFTNATAVSPFFIILSGC